ncbi:hypothetical protein M9435_003727 [Picochlorum sp. BPE23]|nr:hypothetical protein M9435_003727 [Picochlorum sp. BPE23]
MALYTSYYARQLALRPETAGEGDTIAGQVEGEKREQKSVLRRTVDLNGSLLEWKEVSRLVDRPMQHIPQLRGTGVSRLHMLPPWAYIHLPASNVASTFASIAPSKTRSSVNASVWTPDGRRCLTATQAGEFCMWGGQTFQFETIIQAHETPIRTIVFTRNGNFLVSGDDAGHVRYWKTNLELVKSTQVHKESVRQVSFSRTDLKFATASDDSTVRVWDFARVTSEHVLAGHGGDVKTVDWHPQSSLLVSGSKDGLVKVWCARSGASVATMHGHKGTITTTKWNEMNGNWILSASRDQTCRIYDIRMQAELATYVGHGTDLTQAAWHPLQEDLFVSGGHDGSMAFWLAGRQTMLDKVPMAHEGSIWTFAWNPSGHVLTTGAADACTKFWCRCRPGDPFFEQQQAAQMEEIGMEGVVEPPRPVAQPIRAPVVHAPQVIPGLGGGPVPPPPPAVKPMIPARGARGAATAVRRVAVPRDAHRAAAVPLGRGRGTHVPPRGGVQKKKRVVRGRRGTAR